MSWSGRERVVFLLILLVFMVVGVLHLRERDLQQRVSTTEETLDAIVARVEDREQEGRHLRRELLKPRVELVTITDQLDAWGRPLRVEAKKQIVYSFGPDGQDQQGEEDDIVRYFGSLAPAR